MTSSRQRSPAVAGVLSAVLPGLGQLYCRRRWKGAGFLIGFLIVDGVLGVSAAFIKFFQSGNPPENLGQFLFGSLLVLALALWSIVDAVRTAKRSQQ